MTDLSPEERAELADAERAVSEGLWRPVTFDGLLASWAGVAGEVEGGYAASVDDYTNDLTGRDLLEQLLAAASPRLRAKLEGELEPVDERLRAATREGDELHGFFKVGDGWWWHRVPREGLLADYLAAHG